MTTTEKTCRTCRHCEQIVDMFHCDQFVLPSTTYKKYKPIAVEMCEKVIDDPEEVCTNWRKRLPEKEVPK